MSQLYTHMHTHTQRHTHTHAHTQKMFENEKNAITLMTKTLTKTLMKKKVITLSNNLKFEYNLYKLQQTVRYPSPSGYFFTSQYHERYRTVPRRNKNNFYHNLSKQFFLNFTGNIKAKLSGSKHGITDYDGHSHGNMKTVRMTN